MDLSDASWSSSPASLQLICESRARVALYFAAQQEQLANTQRQLTLDRLVKRLGLHSLTASSTTTGLNSISKQQTVSDAMLNRLSEDPRLDACEQDCVAEEIHARRMIEQRQIEKDMARHWMKP